ncbi:MAG: hypothetical protein WED15_04815 [Akkermansiaceae bacterium]
MSSFYSDPAVRQRLVEFLGGETLETATALYLTHSDGCQFQRSELHPPAGLEWFLERDLDIARSLADRESLLLHLDVEYVNFDAPGEAYLDPWRVFELQEPVVRGIERLLLGWGISPLHMITGQGHHFVWRVSWQHELVGRLRQLCPAPELVDRCMERVGSGVVGVLRREQQEGFSAVALLMEFVAHRIKVETARRSLIPVEITAVQVGRGASGRREMVSIDISEYGDPLHTRMVRMPFTNYLKPWLSGLARSLGIENELARFRTIPLHEMDIQQAVGFRQDEAAVLDLARRAGTRIPLQEEGTANLLDAYLASDLRRFHQDYYGAVHDPPEIWPVTYDRTPLDLLPPDVGDLLAWPNDRLLKPGCIQRVTRALMEEGWHPRHIAGLIRSKFENPEFGWGVDWHDYEPGTRADFYTRLFAGLSATGLDRVIDFNSTARLERSAEPWHSSDFSLQRHYELLLNPSRS